MRPTIFFLIGVVFSSGAFANSFDLTIGNVTIKSSTVPKATPSTEVIETKTPERKTASESFDRKGAGQSDCMAIFNGTTDEKKAVDVCLDARGIFKECYFEAKSVFGNLEAAQLCAGARSYFDECFTHANRAHGRGEAVRHCVRARAGFAKCREYAARSLNAKDAIEGCLEARSGFDLCRAEAEKAFADARQLIETCGPAKEKGFGRCYGEVSVFQGRREAVQTCRAAGERFGQCYVLIKDSIPKLQAAEKCALPEPKEEEE